MLSIQSTQCELNLLLAILAMHCALFGQWLCLYHYQVSESPEVFSPIPETSVENLSIFSFSVLSGMSLPFQSAVKL